jgi:hypothetical protein
VAADRSRAVAARRRLHRSGDGRAHGTVRARGVAACLRACLGRLSPCLLPRSSLHVVGAWMVYAGWASKRDRGRCCLPVRPPVSPL